MNAWFTGFIDSSAGLLWTAALQFTCFALLLLIPLAAWRRRPAVRHFLALAALVAALVSPLSAAATKTLEFCWLPIPAWLVPIAESAADQPSNGKTAELHARAQQTTGSSPAANLDGPALESATSQSPDAVATVPVDSTNAADRQSEVRTDDSVAPQTEGSTGHAAAIPRLDGNATSVAGTAAMPSARSAVGSTFRLVDALRVLLAIWLTGFAVCLGRICRIRSRVLRLVNVATSVKDRRIDGIIESAASAVKLRSPVELCASPFVTNPFVFGTVKPHMIVPEALLLADQESQLTHVLLHELSHVVRGDLWIGLVQQWATALFWFHPLVHFDSRLLSEAREELCDNRVLASVAAPDYARTLLQMGEMVSGFSAAGAPSLLSRRQTLESRIARLLEPRRDRTTRLEGVQSIALVLLVGMLAIAVAGIGPRDAAQSVAAATEKELVPETPPTRSPSSSDAAVAADVKVPGGMELVNRISRRVAYFLNPPPAVSRLEYDFDLGFDQAPVKVEQGSDRPIAVWQGATLHGGLHELLHAPDNFEIMVERPDGEGTITIRARVKADDGSFKLHAGNGIEGSWHGYFSLGGARETTLTVDEERLVPLKEETRGSTILYRDWQEVEPGRWVPLRVEVFFGQTHYRMHFDWLGKAIWLLRFSESVSSQSTVAMTHVRNVRINGQPVAQPVSEQAARSQAAVRTILELLDHNRPWLDRGPAGTGWQPPFDTLSYAFHTLREDVVESCVLDRNGEAVVEVTHDGLGSMKDRLGARYIALTTEEYGSATGGAAFATLHQRPQRVRGQPFDLALKHYARIGCQFDLPLFRYRERIESAKVEIAAGEWNGVACRKATVTGLGGQIILGCGTMFGFTSWSYVHHIYPSQEVFYIDPGRNVPLHETLTSGARTFEIDFSDYVEPVPGQFAPLSIRVASPDYFDCEYHFQFIGKTHWMLKEVVSWFAPGEKSRGVVEGVQIDGNRRRLDESLQQVAASRKLFARDEAPQDRVNIAIVPFVLGDVVRAGACEVRVTLSDSRTVAVNVSTANRATPPQVPVLFFDEQRRLLFAPSITLAEKGGQRQGRAEIRGSQVWSDVRFIAVPVDDQKAAKTISVNVVPFRWNEPIAINVPDSNGGKTDTDAGEEEPHAARTRAIRVQVDRHPEGSARAKLDVVSIDGPHEFYLDVSLAAVGRAGELLAAGHLATSLKVVSDPVERQYDIDLGAIPAGAEPMFLVIGISPGNVTRAPGGSQWMRFLNETLPFPIDALLASSDENLWKMGLAALANGEANKSIFKEFHDENPDGRRVNNAPLSRHSLLKPHREALRRIVRDARQPDVLALAARFLAYSEDDLGAKLLEPLLAHDAEQVREAAVIGLTFLKSDAHFDTIRAMLEREAPSSQAEPAARKLFEAHEQDILIALVYQASDAAIDLLGTTLLSDFNRLTLASDEKQQEFLRGRADRAHNLCKLLGNASRPRAAHWLALAADLIAERPELSRSFKQDRLIASLLKFEPATQDRIAAAIESGKSADQWAHALKGSRNPYYVPAIRAMLRRDDLTSGGMSAAIRYLANVDSPQALAGLQECYERGLHRDDRFLWLTLCRSLAAAGDARGLTDAFLALVSLEQPADLPQDEKNRRNEIKTRDRLRDAAREVATSASRDSLRKFLIERAGIDQPRATALEDQRVILDLLWTLPGLPRELSPVVRQWTESSDRRISQSATRLLERE